MSKIKAAQNERDRLSMLLEEYVGVVADESTRMTRTYKDELWLLVTKLSSTFEHSDPTVPCELFQNAPEVNERGIEDLLSFYESGRLRFKQVLQQDVYKTEPRVSAGRRKRDVKRYQYAQLEKIRKQKSTQQEQIQTVEQSDASMSMTVTKQC